MELSAESFGVETVIRDSRVAIQCLYQISRNSWCGLRQHPVLALGSMNILLTPCEINYDFTPFHVKIGEYLQSGEFRTDQVLTPVKFQKILQFLEYFGF